MTREDRFVSILADVESSNNPSEIGDHGLARGRFQWHYDAWSIWVRRGGGTLVAGMTWDALDTLAVRAFHRIALQMKPELTDEAIMMAYHLHGFHDFHGYDQGYAERWRECAARYDAAHTARSSSSDKSS
jgi:hypothetical protein